MSLIKHAIQVAENGVVITDIAGCVVWINQAFTKMTGYNEEDVVGKKTNLLKSGKHEDLFYKKLWDTISTGKVWQGELINKRKDNSFYHEDMTITPISEDEKIINYIAIKSDITDRKEIEIERQRLANKKHEALGYLQEVKDNFDRIFHNSQDAVLIIEDNRFISINKVAQKILGTENIEQLLGIHPSDCSPLFQPDGMESHEKAEKMIAIAKQKGFHRFEWMHKKISGENFLVMVTLTLMKFRGKEQLHVVWQDITSQKELENNLRKSAKQAENISFAKGRFLANMSHEIRTPMNGILGIGRMLQNMGLKDTAGDLVDKLMYSAKSLLGLLNDILDYSKIEEGQLLLEYRNFNLKEMIDNVVSVMSVTASEKNLYLQSCIDDALPVWICGDDTRLRQILFNLISNAIKFTENGGVKILADVLDSSSDKLEINFSIIDTGIGIEESKVKNIFDSFTQAEIGTSRKYGGTGLGLAISKRLVEMMDGEIDCTSNVGVGSTFTFTICVEKGMAQEASEEKLGNSKHNNLRILLAEDNKINQEVANMVLCKDSHQVKIAETGIEVLDLLSKNDFDLIIMDVHMPEMDGISATKIIRKCEQINVDKSDIEFDIERKLAPRIKGQHIPIIAMTASAMNEDKEDCLKSGMDDYLTKPFMPSDIHTALDKLELSTDGQVDIERKTYFAEKTRNDNYKKIAFTHLKQTYEVEDEVVDKLLASASSSITLAAEKIKIAFEENDKQSIFAVAHNMKGVLLTLGFDDVANKARVIEQQASKGKQIDVSVFDTLMDYVDKILENIGNEN